MQLQFHCKLAACLLLLNLSSPRAVLAADACEITLPTNAVTVFAVDGRQSYFEFTLSGVALGFTVRDGGYKGWCTALPVQTPVGNFHQAILLSSLDTNLPPQRQSDNWDLINYILNHKQGEAFDVQLAIWHFTDAITNGLTDAAIAMINDASVNGEGFVPQAGQVGAVALDWVDNDPPIQPSIMEVRCPRKEQPPTRVCQDFVAGGGFIFGTPTGARANFGVQGGIRHGAFWGGLNYIDHGTGMHVKSRTLTGYLVLDVNCRQIDYAVTVDGLPATATVRVCDNGEPGRDDIFEITLSTGYSAGGDLGGSRPGGGNIQLHRKHCDTPGIRPKHGNNGNHGNNNNNHGKNGKPGKNGKKGKASRH